MHIFVPGILETDSVAKVMPFYISVDILSIGFLLYGWKYIMSLFSYMSWTVRSSIASSWYLLIWKDHHTKLSIVFGLSCWLTADTSWYWQNCRALVLPTHSHWEAVLAFLLQPRRLRPMNSFVRTGRSSHSIGITYTRPPRSMVTGLNCRRVPSNHQTLCRTKGTYSHRSLVNCLSG